MKKYEWKLKSFAKGIDPGLAVKELERIETVYGKLTPETVLDASWDENSILHPLFQWEDDIAAKQYRIQQARSLLNNIIVKVIHDGESKSLSVYEVVNLGEERCYKNIETMTSSDIEQIKKATRQQLGSLKQKLSVYDDFENTIKHIDDALDTI